MTPRALASVEVLQKSFLATLRAWRAFVDIRGKEGEILAGLEALPAGSPENIM